MSQKTKTWVVNIRAHPPQPRKEGREDEVVLAWLIAASLTWLLDGGFPAGVLDLCSHTEPGPQMGGMCFQPPLTITAPGRPTVCGLDPHGSMPSLQQSSGTVLLSVI